MPDGLTHWSAQGCLPLSLYRWLCRAPDTVIRLQTAQFGAVERRWCEVQCTLLPEVAAHHTPLQVVCSVVQVHA